MSIYSKVVFFVKLAQIGEAPNLMMKCDVNVFELMKQFCLVVQMKLFK